MATITTNRANVKTGGLLRELAIDAAVSGSTITYTGDLNHYLIDDEFLDPSKANDILQVPDTTIEDYKIIRYIKTDSLSEDLPVSLPDSTIEEEDVVRQLTFADVDARAVRAIPMYSDGFYYCKATTHTDCRGLTLDQYNACVEDGVVFIEEKDLPTIDTE